MEAVAVRTGRSRRTKEEVLKAILAREAAGLALNIAAILRDDPQMRADVTRIFGSWDAGMRAAGIDPKRVRRIRRWSRQAVIDRIQQLADQGMRLNRAATNRVDPSLPLSARRFFASWDDALKAAGLDPRQHRRKGIPWTRDRMVAAIRDIQAKGGQTLFWRRGHSLPACGRHPAVRIMGRCLDDRRRRSSSSSQAPYPLDPRGSRRGHSTHTCRRKPR